MGGTVASLRGYVENRGGKVVAAFVMTAHQGALNLPVKPSMLAAIKNKHGLSMNQFWQEMFGYEIDKLTQGEAGHLKSANSVDSIRERIASARNEGIIRLGSSRVKAIASAKRTGQLIATGESLVLSAAKFEIEQQVVIERASVEQDYQDSLAMYVQAKHKQIERIEDRLENLIHRQHAKLQKMQSNRPKFLSMPRTRKDWQNTQMQHQERIRTLHVRLEAVREIKEGMGLHSPRVEELARRKMREENPELTAKWDAIKKIERQNQIAMKNRPPQ